MTSQENKLPNFVKNFSSGKTLNATKSSDCKALNVFYPVAASLAQPNRWKYNVSNYLVNLTPMVQGSGITSANVGKMAEVIQDLSIHFGGPLFHAKVVKAAQVANAPFTRNQTAGSIDELVSAFYTVLYNSRIVYSLLHTAFRCQDAVEAVDEDEKYLAPMFNDHYGQDLYLPYNTTTTYHGDTPMSNYTNQPTRQSLCFSSAMSNAQWARLWTAATTCVKLPKGWQDWCQKYFGCHHQVLPSNGDASPRFVTLWPSARLLDTRNTNYQYVTMTNYEYQNASGYWLFGNATMNNLQAFFETAVAIYQDLMDKYAQLEIMFRELKCNLDESFNFARDITGRTIRVATSFDVERLIYSVSLGYRITVNGSQDLPTTCFIERARLGADYETDSLIINRDPTFMVNKLDPDFVKEQGPATFSYRDQILISDQEFALLKYQIAPLSFVSMYYGAAGTAPQRRRMPLVALTNYHTHVANIMAADSTYIYGNIGTANDELVELNTYQLPVLPRAHVDIQSELTPSSAMIALEKAGYFKVLQSNCYNLRDYQIPLLLDMEWRDELCDYMTESLKCGKAKKEARSKRSSVAQETVGQDK